MSSALWAFFFLSLNCDIRLHGISCSFSYFCFSFSKYKNSIAEMGVHDYLVNRMDGFLFFFFLNHRWSDIRTVNTVLALLCCSSIEYCRLMNSIRVRACLSFSSYFVLYFFLCYCCCCYFVFYFILFFHRLFCCEKLLLYCLQMLGISRGLFGTIGRLHATLHSHTVITNCINAQSTAHNEGIVKWIRFSVWFGF